MTCNNFRVDAYFCCTTFHLGRNKHCTLIGYQQVKRGPSATSRQQEPPYSTTQNCEDQPSVLNSGSEYESSRAGLIKKRKDLLDPPVKLQHAKRHMGFCGTDDVQDISEQVYFYILIFGSQNISLFPFTRLMLDVYYHSLVYFFGSLKIALRT